MIPDTTGFHDFFTSSIKKRLPPLLDNLLSFIYSCVCPVYAIYSLCYTCVTRAYPLLFFKEAPHALLKCRGYLNSHTVF